MNRLKEPKIVAKGIDRGREGGRKGNKEDAK